MRAGAPPTGYTVLLPPGWVRIPLRHGTGEALDEKVFRGIEAIPSDVPRDQAVAYRLHVRRKVERLAAEARKAGGLDLYVPVRTRPPTLMAASFLVTEINRPEGADPTPEAVLAQLAADRRRGEPGEVRGIAETLAVRWEYVEPPGAGGADPDTYARHVDYVLPVPGDVGRWLAVSFSTAGDGDPDGEFARALTELFDALMTTFRWNS
ncbi:MULTISPECIES: hypothetical protein [unclassified Streptomyces]|uniref:hypothetical protein n=1 Tax=unclassified Streptomyces TaxID=2593676 RepID=UPI002E284184|nr:hypothetical protein [Streptomyces sp. NBC_00223]